MSEPKSLTRTQIEQLIAYCEERETVKWYYGNREQFEKRHKRIVEYLNELLKQYEPKIGGTD